MIFCEFLEISWNNFFIEHIWVNAVGLSSVKKSEGTSLVKILQSCQFDIKWRKDQLKRKDQK